jgi:hypothetical protein
MSSKLKLLDTQAFAQGLNLPRGVSRTGVRICGLVSDATLKALGGADGQSKWATVKVLKDSLEGKIGYYSVDMEIVQRTRISSSG